MPRIKRRDDLTHGIKWGPYTFRTVTAATTILTGEEGEDEGILADGSSGGSFTVTMPKVTDDVIDAYIIKNIGASGTITVDGDGAELIDGATTIALASQWDCAVLATDNVEWHVIGKVGTW